jgi:putative lipoprotein (rSAM/lipoprotein system)
VKRIFRKTTFRFLKLLSLAISALLGVLCNFGGAMYGMPNAEYKISGTVKDAEQSLPVKGLSVSIRDTMNTSGTIDSTKTDSLGKYSMQFSGAPWRNTWDLKVEDIDSIENGSFTPKDTVISIPESDLQEPNGDWYKGHGEKTVDLKVNRKD